MTNRAWTNREWKELMLLLAPVPTESVYWKYMAEQLGKSGGQYWPLADDFLAGHQQEYFHYEAERQSAQ